jgi:hypothetical protein
MNLYLDFDLHFRRTDTGYRVQVLGSPAGQASVDFTAPFSDLELENLLLRIGRPRRSTRRMASPEIDAVRQFGAKLFSAVFAADVLACFRMSLEKAIEQNAGLRIRLRLAEVPELSDLPWEYLYNATLKRFLSLSAETPVVRYLDLAERIQPLLVDLPIRVLVMVASPKDYPALDVEAEWSKLKSALSDLEAQKRVVIERLPQATLQALQRHLRRETCHVFHFIGHGGFDAGSGEGLLVLEDDQGRADPVGSQYLGALLHDHRPLRVAVLNACEGARGGRSDPFAGTAQSLVQQGIPAVIAMQFEITDEAAIVFAHELYLAIADGWAVDAALAEARKALYARTNDVEWGTPVLYMRASDGRIFDVAKARPHEPAAVPAPHSDSRTSVADVPAVDAPGGGAAAARPPRVYISYSWDSEQHKRRVLELSNRLRGDGVETHLDQYEVGPPSWKRWQEEQVRSGSFVLMVCTESYRQRVETTASDQGASIDGRLIRDRLASAPDHRWLVVAGFGHYRDSAGIIPGFVGDAEYYNIGGADGYARLLARLLGKPIVEPPPVSPSRARATAGEQPPSISVLASSKHEGPKPERVESRPPGSSEPIDPKEAIDEAERALTVLLARNDVARSELLARVQDRAHRINQRSVVFPATVVLLGALGALYTVGAVTDAFSRWPDGVGWLVSAFAVTSAVVLWVYISAKIKRDHEVEVNLVKQELEAARADLDASDAAARATVEALREKLPAN